MDGLPVISAGNIVGTLKLDEEFQKKLEDLIAKTHPKLNLAYEYQVLDHNKVGLRSVMIMFEPAVRGVLPGDTISGQCQEREYGVNGFRRCQFAAHHSDPHDWGPWE